MALKNCLIKNITSHYPLNMIGFGEKTIFLGHPTGWGGGTKNITSHYPINIIDLEKNISFFGTPYWVGGGDKKYHKQLPFKYD